MLCVFCCFVFNFTSSPVLFQLMRSFTCLVAQRIIVILAWLSQTWSMSVTCLAQWTFHELCCECHSNAPQKVLMLAQLWRVALLIFLIFPSPHVPYCYTPHMTLNFFFFVGCCCCFFLSFLCMRFLLFSFKFRHILIKKTKLMMHKLTAIVGQYFQPQ